MLIAEYFDLVVFAADCVLSRIVSQLLVFLVIWRLVFRPDVKEFRMLDLKQCVFVLRESSVVDGLKPCLTI